MARYAINGGKLTVKARSSVHDTTTVWDKVSGDVEASADAIEQATATFSVDMSKFDAGDFLKNRKLKGDLDVARHPTARFTLAGLDAARAEVTVGAGQRAARDFDLTSGIYTLEAFKVTGEREGDALAITAQEC